MSSFVLDRQIRSSLEQRVSLLEMQQSDTSVGDSRLEELSLSNQQLSAELEQSKANLAESQQDLQQVVSAIQLEKLSHFREVLNPSCRREMLSKNNPVNSRKLKRIIWENSQ